jgi:hypothetical protein
MIVAVRPDEVLLPCRLGTQKLWITSSEERWRRWDALRG